MTINPSTVSSTVSIQSALADRVLKKLAFSNSFDPNFMNERSVLRKTVLEKNNDILTYCKTTDVKLLPYGDNSLDLAINTLILDASVDFIFSSKGFCC